MSARLLCLLLLAATATALQLPARPRASAPRMQSDVSGWQQVVRNAQERAATVKAEQEATAGAMAVGTLAVFALPLIDNFVLDLTFSALVGGGATGYVAGFREDAVGDAARSVGKVVSSVVLRVLEKAREVDTENGISERIKAQLSGGNE
mmetsp:Transcript_38002/g.65166  ORF Transcript_38002/g.65166 Transcript_38002/m.65166 type:complete len:150 (+) Transcript_38002:22-471(+)